jgi:hypothetical protein
MRSVINDYKSLFKFDSVKYIINSSPSLRYLHYNVDFWTVSKMNANITSALSIIFPRIRNTISELVTADLLLIIIKFSEVKLHRLGGVGRHPGTRYSPRAYQIKIRKITWG